MCWTGRWGLQRGWAIKLPNVTAQFKALFKHNDQEQATCPGSLFLLIKFWP